VPVFTNCNRCGVAIKMPPSQFNRSKRHFCSNACKMKTLNKELNPDRMTPEVREKLRKARLGSGESKTYTKTYGTHTHRVVAEQKLGRKLLPGEVVHHIDGDKRNNNPENLMVFASQEEHAALHVREEKFFFGTVLGQEVIPK
jgi:hypothetical protein